MRFAIVYNVVRSQTVQVDPYPDDRYETRTKKAATAKARKWAAEHPNNYVFIRCYRHDDGQVLFLNRDGFELKGVSWTDPSNDTEDDG